MEQEAQTNRLLPNGPSGMHLAIYETVLEHELKGVDELIERKAKRLMALEGRDLFEMPEPEAKKIVKEIEFLTDELHKLLGTRSIFIKLKEAYEKSVEQIYDAYNTPNCILANEVDRLQKENEMLRYSAEQNAASADTFSDLLLERLEKDRDRKRYYG